MSQSLLALLIWLLFTVGLLKAEPPVFTADEGSAGNYPVTEEHRIIAREIFLAIERRDADWVAERVEYPILAGMPGERPVKVDSREKFREILTANFKAGLDRRMMDEIRAHPKLFSNWSGVMMGHGVVWFHGGGPEPEKMRILAFGFAHQP